MAKYKNIRVRKAGGGFRLQRVQILASGKYKFVKNTQAAAKPKTKRKTKRGTQTMARKRRRTYKRKSSQPKSFLSGAGRYIAPIAYGAFRHKVSEFINSSAIGRSFPASAYTDEALMLGGLMIAQKLGVGKKGIARSIIAHGKTIELSRIGQTLGSQGFGLNLNAKPKNSLYNGGGY